MSVESEVAVEGRRLKLTNLDKVLYPATGFTKADVIDYYVRIAPVILPHLHDRPLTLKRYPNGVDAKFFYEKECPSFRPGWMRLAKVWSVTRRSHICFCLMNDLPSLVWAANLADLEMHTTLAVAKDPDRPTMLVFDLDPGAPAALPECARVALWLKELFDGLRLESFVKTSGSKGIQVYVPLNTKVTYADTKPFARSVAELLEREHPELVVSQMSKALRRGKVFIDWSQNDRHKTTVCAYSLRAKDRPTVSMPLDWDELKRALKAKRAERLVFGSDEALARVEKLGDLFAPVLELKQKLPRAL